MAAPKTSYELFQQTRHQNSTRLGSILPITVASLIGFVQYFFTDELANVSHVSQVLILAAIAIIYGARYFIKNPSYWLQAIDCIALHAITVYSVAFLTPIPSPYLIFVLLMTTMTYLRFGYRAMLLSMYGMFTFITASYLYRYGVSDVTALINYFATYGLIMVMTYYSIVFLRYSENELKAVSAASQDAISQQKQMESLINNISDGVIAVDRHNKVKVYNAAALDVLDLNTDIKGKSIAQLIHPIDETSQPVSMTHVLKETTVPTINRDLRVKYKDGSVANLFLGIAPVYLGFGKSENNGYTIVLRDITREKSLEEERDEFISVVSHELRTPIAISEGNIGNAEYIVEKTGDLAAVKTALKEAHNQVLFLASMINDLSTLSRAERGVLQVEPEAIAITELAQELLSNYTPDATKKGLTLGLELSDNLPDLQSGKLYVREVLQNFITNAIKYTETGSVTIGAKPGDNGITFYVRDTGIGISKGDQERVFDKFFRSEDYRTRQNNGTGLGLYVTMKLTRLLKAQISVASELNKGSTFTIFFPNLAEATKAKP
ncbi:MAG: PAS domain-containing sensor histidine kinase [Patescibacteria group bacterium]|nr:PAS domain-containing sensor histidine kinase [Patescibacteria group bacterium]